VKTALDAGRLGRLVLASAYVKWHRTAQYYTGYRGSLVLDGPPLARLHALWTLHGTEQLDRDTVLAALGDKDERVAAAAIRLAEKWLHTPSDTQIYQAVIAVKVYSLWVQYPGACPGLDGVCGSELARDSQRAPSRASSLPQNDGRDFELS
jgi:hypothetical protein